MTLLEMTQKFKSLEARVAELENALKGREIATVAAMNEAMKQLMDSASLASKPLDPVKLEQNVEKIGKKLCPKCGKVPGYFFHVRSCKGP